MVYYEQRKPRLVLRNAPARGTDPPRLMLRQQRQEPPYSNDNNTTNLPLHMAFLQQAYHGPFQNVVPGSLPYAAFQSQLPMTYNVPTNMNMAPGHLALQTVNPRNHHHNMTVYNDRGHTVGENIYAGRTPVLEERRDENFGRVSPRVALRTMMQQALRPNTQPEKFGHQAHCTQNSHDSRNAFGLNSRGVSVGSDVSICPPIDRGLEANIREQLARSGLLRDCPEPEYVNRPMIVDPSIVSCGRAVKQYDPIHHRRPQYLFSQAQLSEEVRSATHRELSRAPLKVRRTTGIPTYKVNVPPTNVQQVQTYRGVDSVVKDPKRRDSPQPYKVEAGPKFLTKDDYTPTKRIIGYFIDPPVGSPKSAKKIPVQPLSNQEEATPKPFRQSAKNRLGGASEPEMTQAPIREGKNKVNMSEDTPKASVPSMETTDHESSIEQVKTIDMHATNPKNHAQITVERVSDEESNGSPDGKKTADLLEDCIRSLVTWDKGDRKVLHKLLKVLKSLDDDDDNAKPIKDPKITHDTKHNPRKERGSSSSLNPNAACFKGFASARAHTTETRKGYHERRGLSLQEEIIPTSNEKLPMFYPKPLVSTGPVWIKAQQNKFVRPPPGLHIPFKAHVGRKVPVKPILPQTPREDEEGRIAKAMDHRLAEPLLARFYEKYPLTGTICENPPSSPPAPVKNAAEIQEELERLLLQEKEKKAFANPIAVKPRAPKDSCRVEASKLVK
ncbi:hypothetical protein SBOR_2730 [Sclerotinia borealis F-4128]|uniref:Uncharacterized protein n=1 Tax=Sclerotinia borealis (strain F-4128) TaxID=1432307 RepID=W9CQW8_SCLBF|nr:hypothetical protein SBOR_2730 [Sclerotinia borealis F-4128]